jgi:hypothetical protein
MLPDVARHNWNRLYIADGLHQWVVMVGVVKHYELLGLVVLNTEERPAGCKPGERRLCEGLLHGFSASPSLIDLGSQLSKRTGVGGTDWCHVLPVQAMVVVASAIVAYWKPAVSGTCLEECK